MKIFAITLAGIFFTSHLYADSGVREVLGPTYSINETDLISVIQKRLGQKQKSGELAKIQKDYIAKYKDAIENPEPTKGMQRALKSRRYYFDPSIIARTNISDSSGKIIVPAGTSINPLDYVSMSGAKIFIDARDKAQVQFALQANEYYAGNARIILTGGSYMDFMRKHKVRVFYDSHGTIVGRFGIKYLPAVVTQPANEKRLQIDEVAL